MSQENVEIVRASLRAWNAGDMEAWGHLLAPDVVWHVPEDWPEPGPYVGRDAVLREVGQVRATLDTDSVRPTGDFAHVDGCVLVRLAWRGQGRGGAEADMPMTCLYTLSGQKIVEFEFFRDHVQALKAVGLEK